MAGRKPSPHGTGNVVIRFKQNSALGTALRIFCFLRGLTVNDALLRGIELFLAENGISDPKDYVKQFESEMQGKQEAQ